MKILSDLKTQDYKIIEKLVEFFKAQRKQVESRIVKYTLTDMEAHKKELTIAVAECKILSEMANMCKDIDILEKHLNKEENNVR